MLDLQSTVRQYSVLESLDVYRPHVAVRGKARLWWRCVEQEPHHLFRSHLPPFLVLPARYLYSCVHVRYAYDSIRLIRFHKRRNRSLKDIEIRAADKRVYRSLWVLSSLRAEKKIKKAATVSPSLWSWLGLAGRDQGGGQSSKGGGEPDSSSGGGEAVGRVTESVLRGRYDRLLTIGKCQPSLLCLCLLCVRAATVTFTSLSTREVSILGSLSALVGEKLISRPCPCPCHALTRHR